MGPEIVYIPRVRQAATQAKGDQMAKQVETMEVCYRRFMRGGVETDIRLTVGILARPWRGNFNPMTGTGCAPEGPEFEIHGAKTDPDGVDFPLTDDETETLLDTMWDRFCDALADYDEAERERVDEGRGEYERARMEDQ
jgi:hypothetical protein